MEDGPVLREDHKMTHKSAYPGSGDLISKFSDPLYSLWKNRAIRLKFGRDIEDGPLLRVDYSKPLTGCALRGSTKANVADKKTEYSIINRYQFTCPKGHFSETLGLG